MFEEPVIKKVPGKLTKNKKESQGYIEDLKALTKPQLLELIERQDKLLARRGFINALPDKGERIKQYKEKLLNELKRKESSEDLCEVMKGLSLNGKKLAEDLEWSGRVEEARNLNVNGNGIEDDEDEDKVDPLKILVSHSGTGLGKKITRIEEPPEPLITPADLKEIEEGTDSEPLSDDLYAINLCDKLDKVPSKPERFLPYKTLTHKKELSSLNKPKWEVTAATPPRPVHGDTKMVSLEESIRLQKEQAKHLKEVQIKHAADRLRDKMFFMGDRMPSGESATHYRDTHESDGEESEVNDEDDVKDTGGVTFTVTE